MKNINLNLSRKNFQPVLSLYFFTLSASLLGFSIYLFLEAVSIVPSKITTWSGEGLLWALVTFFAGLFIGYLPVEFFNSYSINLNSFKDLVTSILYSIVISLFFLVIFQLLIPKNPSVLLEIYNITNAVSLSGFIVVPGILFLTDYFKNSIFILEKFRFSITLFFWTVSIQIFL